MNPDPMGIGSADLGNPQSLNQYAYVLNNPVTLVDPSGLYPCPGYIDSLLVTAQWGVYDGPDCFMPTDPMFYLNGMGFPTVYGILPGENSINWPLGSGNPWADIWADVLGLPSGLSCPDVGGLSSYLCGGVDPIMDVTRQQQQDCLKEIYNTPDGKFYDYFSFVSPLIGPDASLGDAAYEGSKEAAQRGGKRFLKAAAKNWKRTGLGAFSRTASEVLEAVDQAINPLAWAATVDQVAMYTGCAWVP
jgi:hypothetical protein